MRTLSALLLALIGFGARADHILVVDLNGACFPESEEVRLVGTVYQEAYYGPPNYGETPEQDEQLEAVILKLSEPIEVHFVDAEAPQRELAISELQVVGAISPDRMKGERVVLVGKLFSRLSGYHRREILMMLSNTP